MSPIRHGSIAFAVIAGATCGACGVPRFDVPTDSAGQPTVQTIVERIKCEMRDMVRDDSTDPASYHRHFLLDGDYDVEIQLSLEVNDSGGLLPSASWIDPLSKVSSFTLAGSATLSEARDHNPDTNLAGTLGLKDFVAMAALTPDLDSSLTLSGKGVFGGSVQFIVTKNLTSFGPTWALVHFKGPGAVSLSEANTDGLLLSFAQGPHVGVPMTLTRAISPNPPNRNAHLFLQQLLTDSINSQLNQLQNKLP